MANSETDLASDAQEENLKPKLALEVQVEQRGACKRHVTVTVPRTDIDRYFKEAFDELAPKAEVPGFRPGRAPRKLVETRFREQMANQVKGSLLMDSVTQINEESSFSAISEPDFDFEAIELPDEGPMKFEFEIEVRPEFELPQWKGLRLTRPVREYSNAEVDSQMKRLLSRYGRLVSKEGPAEELDRIELKIVCKDGEDIVTTIDDEVVEIRPQLSFRDATLDGFDKLVLGCNAGDLRTVRLKVSDQAEREELRGKELEIELHVVDVKRMELPEMTPAFLDSIGGFENEASVREAVREELERQLVFYQQRQIRQQISGLLTQSADWELPSDLLRRQSRREMERAVLELRASGFTDDFIRAYQNRLRQNSEQATAVALKEHFILERIAEEEKIDAEPGDYDNEVRLIAAQSQESSRRVRARLEKRGQMDALRNQIVERKVIGLITSHAEFTEVPFEPHRDDTAAIDRAISGHDVDAEIPEAKYQGEVEELPGASTHS
jgi:trigger factor